MHDSPYLINLIINSKNAKIRALHLAVENESVFPRLVNTKNIFFSFLAAGFWFGFCPKHLALARKIMAFPDCRELQHPPAPQNLFLTKDEVTSIRQADAKQRNVSGLSQNLRLKK